MNASAMITLPPEIRDASAWYGPELKERTDWIAQLSAAEIAEVERAAKELPEDLTSITTDDAPLPTLGLRLQGSLEEVVNGRGFVLIRGLPIDGWTKREAAIAFLVIGIHLGRLRMQNAAGHLLRLWLAPPNARPLPEVFAERCGSVMPGDRGGVVVQGSRPQINTDEYGS